jgi:hypothetical protein
MNFCLFFPITVITKIDLQIDVKTHLASSNSKSTKIFGVKVNFILCISQIPAAWQIHTKKRITIFDINFHQKNVSNFFSSKFIFLFFIFFIP